MAGAHDLGLLLGCCGRSGNAARCQSHTPRPCPRRRWCLTPRATAPLTLGPRALARSPPQGPAAATWMPQVHRTRPTPMMAAAGLLQRSGCTPRPPPPVAATQPPPPSPSPRPPATRRQSPPPPPQAAPEPPAAPRACSAASRAAAPAVAAAAEASTRPRSLGLGGWRARSWRRCGARQSGSGS